MKKYFIIGLLAILSVSAITSCSLFQGKDMGPLTATVKTNKGDIVIPLYGEATPMTVANFVNLANRGYYDGIIFHRVIDNFMVQVGDPNSLNSKKKNLWGQGGPGYAFADEFVDSLKHDRIGTLSMANSGPATNGSQLFITHTNTDWLNGKHTVFGQIAEEDTESQAVLNSIAQGDNIITVVISGAIPEEVKAMQSQVDEWNNILDTKAIKTNPELKLKEAQPFK